MVPYCPGAMKMNKTALRFQKDTIKSLQKHQGGKWKFISNFPYDDEIEDDEYYQRKVGYDKNLPCDARVDTKLDRFPRKEVKKENES